MNIILYEKNSIFLVRYMYTWKLGYTNQKGINDKRI